MNSPNNLYANLIGIPEVQRLNLRLMELASFNSFDGPKVVKDLLDNKELWQACVMDREGYFPVEGKFPRRRTHNVVSLIKLRDMCEETVKRLGEQLWNVDTLYIVPINRKQAQQQLYVLVKKWNADEADWIDWPFSGKFLGGALKGTRILRVWWD